jgi:hypothetical protein
VDGEDIEGAPLNLIERRQPARREPADRGAKAPRQGPAEWRSGDQQAAGPGRRLGDRLTERGAGRRGVEVGLWAPSAGQVVLGQVHAPVAGVLPNVL